MPAPALLLLLGCIALANAGRAKAQDTLPDIGRDTSGRVAPEGPYRSRMRIVGEDETRPAPGDVDIALESLANDNYGRSLLLRRLGYADAARGDYASAALKFEDALRTAALDPLALAQIRQNLGALYVAGADFPRAVATLEPLLTGVYPPEPETLYALAYAYARVDRHADTLAALARAFAQRSDPPVDWLRLRLHAQGRLGRYADAAVTQTRLLAAQPQDEAGWRQLAGLHHAAGSVDRAVAALLVAEARGLFRDEPGIELIARTQMAAGMPYQAARRLDDALASGSLSATQGHYRLNADAWLAAREYRAAVAPLARAASLSGDADLYLRLGDIHRDLGEWDDAVVAYRAVTRRGGPLAARAWLGLGESRYRAGDARGARSAFREATAYGGVYRDATQWLAFLGDADASTDAPGTLAEQARDDGDSTAAADTPDRSAEAVALAHADASATVDIKQVPAGRYYMTSETVSAQTALDRALRLARDLRTAVNRQRIAPAGPLHVVLKTDDDQSPTLSLSIGIPVRGTAPPSGAFRARRLDAFQCAWFLYEGAWDDLPSAWQAFEKRVAASGRTVTGERRQVIYQRGRGDTISRVELQVGVLGQASDT